MQLAVSAFVNVGVRAECHQYPRILKFQHLSITVLGLGIFTTKVS